MCVYCMYIYAPAYNNALTFSGFNENIQFTSTPSPRRNRNRKLYGVIVKTNIGRIFLCLIDKNDFINTAYYLIEAISRLATVACQTWQVSSEAITPVY